MNNIEKLRHGMRVCFLSALHPPFDKRVFDKEAKTLANAGLEVIHLAPGNPGDITIDGVRIVTYCGPKSLWQRIKQLRRLYLMAASLEADVYHCNEVDSWVIGVFLRYFKKSICVFDVHEHYPEDFAEMRFTPILQPLVRSSVRIVMHFLSLFTDRIVLAKPSLERDFPTYPAKHISLVQNFVPLEQLPTLVKKDSAELKGPIQLIHLGLINRVRGWPQMLEGLVKARNQEIKLLVLGEISNNEESLFLSEVKRLRLSNRVKYRTSLPFGDAMKEVINADAGIILFQPGYFNHKYALPHKLFDYMGCGLPVIAPRFAVEVANIVFEAQCGLLVDAADPQDFADAIDALADDIKESRAMGQRGRLAVENFFNWGAEGRKLVTMYAGLGP